MRRGLDDSEREGLRLLVSRGAPAGSMPRQVSPLEEAREALNATAAQAAGRRPRGPPGRSSGWRPTIRTRPSPKPARPSGSLPTWSPAGSPLPAQRAKKDYAAALIDAQVGVAIGSASPPMAHLAAGDVWRDQRQTEHARRNTLGGRAGQKHCEAYLRLAQARLASLSPTQWSEAAEDFTKTIGLAEHAPACRRAARLGRANGLERRSLHAGPGRIQRIDRRKQKDIEALAGRGTVIAELFRYEKGVARLEEAIELAPKDVHCLVVLRATIRMKQYNFRGAIKDLDEAVKLDPNRSEAYLVRGQMLARQKKWAAAIAALTQSIDSEHNASAYLARADAYQAKGDADLAKADRAQVGRLNPLLLAPPSGKEVMEQDAAKRCRNSPTPPVKAGIGH